MSNCIKSRYDKCPLKNNCFGLVDNSEDCKCRLEDYQQGRADAIDDFADFIKHNWRIEAAHVLTDYPTTNFAIGKFLANLVDLIKNEYKEKNND